MSAFVRECCARAVWPLLFRGCVVALRAEPPPGAVLTLLAFNGDSPRPYRRG